MHAGIGVFETFWMCAKAASQGHPVSLDPLCLSQMQVRMPELEYSLGKLRVLNDKTARLSGAAFDLPAAVSAACSSSRVWVHTGGACI
jgi:hypothetical protein